MSNLREEFNKIMAKVEERFTNEDELNFIKEQILEVSMLYINELNKVIDLSERRVNQVVENQRILENKQNEIERALNNMEKELFVNEEEYDFEIICPYCNHEFVSDIGSDISELVCPECHNTIELDWDMNEDSDCSGHCCSCEGCEHDEEDEVSEEEENEDEDM